MRSSFRLTDWKFIALTLLIARFPTNYFYYATKMCYPEIWSTKDVQRPKSSKRMSPRELGELDWSPIRILSSLRSLYTRPSPCIYSSMLINRMPSWQTVFKLNALPLSIRYSCNVLPSCYVTMKEWRIDAWSLALESELELPWQAGSFMMNSPPPRTLGKFYYARSNFLSFYRILNSF